jgi:hypothetical protein
MALEFQAANLVDCVGSFNSRAARKEKTFSPALNLEIPPTVGGCGPTRSRTGLEHKGSAGLRRWSWVLVLAGATGSWSGGEVKKIYVGNLPFSATEDDIRQLFGQHGEVNSVALIMDRETGRPRGFGFIEMDDNEATAAISALNGHEMDGRALNVNEARDRPKRDGGGGRRSPW